LDKIKIVDLAVAAKKRLDQVFPEEDGSAAEQAEKRQSLFHALSKLKPLASAMEWKVPRTTLREYLRELSHVRASFSDDKDAVLLIRIKRHLLRQIDASPTAVHPGMLTLLRNGYGALEVLAAEPEGSSRRARAVKHILAEYTALSRAGDRAFGGPGSSARASGRAGRNSARPFQAGGPPAGQPTGARLENRSYYLIPVDQLDDLKTFIRDEIERLLARILGSVKNR
jgi:hypothetical protein